MACCREASAARCSAVAASRSASAASRASSAPAVAAALRRSASASSWACLSCSLACRPDCSQTSLPFHVAFCSEDDPGSHVVVKQNSVCMQGVSDTAARMQRYRGIGIAGDRVQPLLCCLLCLEQLLVPGVKVGQPGLSLFQGLPYTILIIFLALCAE